MMENRQPRGARFVWYDLLTVDFEKSKRYYSELFGWTVEDDSSGSDDGCRLISNRKVGIGGMIPLDAGKKTPPSWRACVAVEDIQASVALAGDLGATVHVERTRIPAAGDRAVVVDPQGGTIALLPIAGGEPMTEDPENPAPGTFCWNELLTPDPEASQSFYQRLFAWDMEKVDMGPAGFYHLFKRGRKQEAGMMKKPPEAQGPAMWLPYVAVSDVDETAARVLELGGMLHVQPRDIPEVGRFSVTADSQGTAIALFTGSKGQGS